MARSVHVAVLVLLVENLVCAQTYRVTDLGALPGTDESRGTGINQAGQAVGHSTSNPLFGPHIATLWHADGTMVDMGTLGGLGATAADINSSGLVVGMADIAPGVGSPSHAFSWTASGMTDLGTLGGTSSWAEGINQLGQVVGGSRIAPEDSPHPAFWGLDGSILDLGLLPLPDQCCGAARGIDATGHVVGYSTSVFAQPRAVRWTVVNGVVTDMRNLGVLPGGCCSDAFGINDGGRIVGVSKINGPIVAHAFVWEDKGQGGTMTDLGVLPGGTSSEARAINTGGLIVGSSWTTTQAPGDPHGVIWRNQTVCDLNDLVSDPQGWTMVGAMDIDDAGQIVGFGVQQDTELSHALRLTPVQGSPGDFDGDSDVDLGDVAYFSSMMTGPGDASNPPANDAACSGSVDFGGDGDVDLEDYAVLERWFTGSG